MLKVMTFNLASSFGIDKRSDWTRCAEIIRRENPDFVACEEVSVHEDFEPDLDMPALYGKYLNMTPVFGRATSRDGKGDYGVMALARHQITPVEKIMLPNRDGYEQRIALVTKVEAGEPYYFIVTHFPTLTEYPGVAENRCAAIALITDTIREKQWYPTIMAGDFNVPPDNPAMDFIRENWDVCNDTQPVQATHHSGVQIDYICTFPKGKFKTMAFKAGAFTMASDHAPVVAFLE